MGSPCPTCGGNSALPRECTRCREARGIVRERPVAVLRLLLQELSNEEIGEAMLEAAYREGYRAIRETLGGRGGTNGKDET